MDLYGRIRERISEKGALPRLDPADIDALRNRCPGLPADYLRYLTEVGYGDLGEFQLHSGPSAAKSFYANNLETLEHVMVFGDDKQGYCFGFDTSDGYRVVEISPGGDLTKDVESDFLSLVQGYFG